MHTRQTIFSMRSVSQKSLVFTLEHVTEGHLIVDELVKENFLYNFASSIFII